MPGRRSQLQNMAARAGGVTLAFDRQGGEAIRAAIAAHAGVAPSEPALTRNATEAQQNLIANYRLLKPGFPRPWP